RVWAFYAIGDPGGTTPTFTSDTSRDFAWAVSIVAGGNVTQPFGAAVFGGSTSGSGGIFCAIAPTPYTDCMVLALVSAGAASRNFTSGTWTEDVEPGNVGASLYGYQVHNVTNYTAVNYGGNGSPVWNGSAGGTTAMTLSILPA